MKFALLMYADPAYTEAMSKEAVEVVLRKHEALREELLPSGELIGGAGLNLPKETSWLRLEGDETVVGKGPLVADSVDQVTAYYELQCETLERAQEIAARILDDHVVAVEVRGIHNTTEKPDR
jgi:hypothetical protein